MSGQVATYNDSLLEVIAKAARDPNVDIDKMERLLQMQERVQARDAEQAFNQAMNIAQEAMRPISANASNPQTKSRYATYDKLDRVLRPIYTANGFSLSFDEGDSPKPDHVRVLCYVSHVAGHTRTYHRDMPADGKGAKGGDVMTKTHAAGAAGSYGARYLLKGIFNVAVGEDDDDGNDVRETLSPADYAKIVQLVEATNTNVPTMLKALRIPAVPLDKLTPREYDKAVDALENKLARIARAETNAKAGA
jgi:hypothetical protein